MQIILIKDVKNFGKQGESKNVTDGYARNYLLPNKLAVIYNESLKNKFELQRKNLSEKASKKIEEQDKFLLKLNGLEIVFKERANDDLTLFQGLGKEKIAKKINEICGVSIKPEIIKLEKSIKKIGNYDVPIIVNKKESIIKINIIKDDPKRM
ncbi:MAG: 50S ribosomal protein L9 [Patescibacteria group bacterium]|jgi:large subunit ribosomal protein L9